MGGQREARLKPDPGSQCCPGELAQLLWAQGRKEEAQAGDASGTVQGSTTHPPSPTLCSHTRSPASGVSDSGAPRCGKSQTLFRVLEQPCLFLCPGPTSCAGVSPCFSPGLRFLIVP